MLISPPFLPLKEQNQLDADWLNNAMVCGQPGDGAFPISFSLGWHGGAHLTAPLRGNVSERVRAVADGTVVFKRSPVDHQSDENHPQNYRGAWTDNGCVVIRHETAIGEGTNAATVKFFSVYMHLSELHARVVTGQKIYRKEELGQAGQIYGGTQRKIHFEIVCDDGNLRKLVGRASGSLNFAQNGRVDAVYGEMYFHLPAGAEVFSEKPVPQLTRAHSQLPRHAHSHPSVPLQMTAAYTTTTALLVGLRYVCGDGDATRGGDACVRTYTLDGKDVGAVLREEDAEYNLYFIANTISEAFPPASQPAPSAVYEMLRFGRIVNTEQETLDPADVPHWRQVNYSGGTGWVNLNAAGITKFSDADFPHWRGWVLIDDSQDLDSRCDSPVIKGWLDINHDGRVTHAEAVASLNDPAIQSKLVKTICKFPSEWQAASIDRRWGWLKAISRENEVPLTTEDFQKLKAHIEALCFAAPELDAALWHWHPMEFIKHFRMCGWLSDAELTQLVPRQFGRIPSNVDIQWRVAKDRINSAHTHISATAINKIFRKFGFNTANRQTAFLSQSYIETGIFRTVIEGGQGADSHSSPMTHYYAAFYGRGLMQLTWASAYESYGKFRKFPNNVTGNYVDRRITTTSMHHWNAPTIVHGVQHNDVRRWSPRYDPDILATDSYNMCDSACFFWVTKSFLGEKNINRIADQGITTETVGRMSVLVNGGPNGYNGRQQYAGFIYRYRSDTTDVSAGEDLSVFRQIIHSVDQHTVWATSGAEFDVYVSYKAQRE